jgi:hypothetical protein
VLAWPAPHANDSAELTNAGFNGGTGGWLLHATPNISYLVSSVVNGVFNFSRTPPPPGTANQAAIFQETRIPLAANAPIVAQFDLGNSSSVRKRISVLILNADFSDLSVCTFWLPSNTPLQTYAMRMYATELWTQATISI